MPDVYNTITSAEPALVQRIAQALEVRGADDQQKSMLGSYLAEIKFPANARVIEVGCGTGPVSCVFRTKPATESGAKKPPVPAQTSHCSGLIRPPGFCGVRLS